MASKLGFRHALAIGASGLALTATSVKAQTSPNSPAPAVSTDDSASAGDIVVTAQRRSESILRVPISVSSIGGADLAARHTTQLGELSAQVPNVEINSPRGSSLTDVVIRGVGIANDFTLNQASPVGVYLDDSYMASRTFSSAQAYDLERMEVLRGPQGTLFGRNTTGGLINFITRVPKLDGNSGYLDLGYGNFNDVRIQGAVELTSDTDVFGVRVAGTYHRHDGYYTNIAAGQPNPENLNTLAGRIVFRFKPIPDLDLSLKVYGQRDSNRQWNVRIKLAGATVEMPSNPYDVDIDPGNFQSSSGGAQFKLNARLSPALSIINLTSYDRGYLNLDAVDLDGRSTGPTVPGYTTQFQTTHFEQLNQEVRLNLETSRLKAVLGGYYGQDIVRDNVRYDVFVTSPLSPRFRYNQRRISKAVFAQVDYSPIPSLTFTGGLRYTRDTVEYRHGHADVFTPGVPGGVLNTLPGAFTASCAAFDCPNAELPTLKGSNGAITGRAAVKYDIAPSQILYVSYSRGYRSGAFNGNAYLTLSQLSYVKPETVDAYEAGLKGKLFDGAVKYSLAAFYNSYRDQQVNYLQAQVTALGTFPVNILGNVPRATTKGIELESTIVPVTGLSVHVAAGVLDAKYAASSVIAGVAIGNNRLPYAPRFTGSVGVDWRVARVAGGDVNIAPTLVHSSSYYYDPTGDPNVSTSGYTRVNATIAWKLDGLTVSVWGNNLSNNKYNGFGLNLVANTGNYYYNGAPPRTFGVAVSKTF